MRSIGTVLGLLTIVMVLVKPLGIIAAILLALRGQAEFSILAGGLMLAGLVFSFAVDAMRWVLRFAGGAPAGVPLALLTGCLPIALTLLWEYAIFEMLGGREMGVAEWATAYLAATAFLSLRAWRAVPEEATLRGVECYAGQAAFMILGLTALWLDWPLWLVLPLAAFPAVLPSGIGIMLALADPMALRDVQI